jgi:RNA polymerase sigma-70 factor (ECF subfamily)
MSAITELTDEKLLCSLGVEEFGVFYDRHVKSLLAYFARRTGDPEVAADLTAETFASAIVARARFKAEGPPAAAWLYTIASRRLADYQRRGRVEQRVRRSLAMERRSLSAEDVGIIRLLADDTATALLTELPSEQRDAVTAYVVEGRGYGEIAGGSRTSEAAVRQRVSRGLGSLRRRIGRVP